MCSAGETQRQNNHPALAYTAYRPPCIVSPHRDTHLHSHRNQYSPHCNLAAVHPRQLANQTLQQSLKVTHGEKSQDRAADHHRVTREPGLRSPFRLLPEHRLDLYSFSSPLNTYRATECIVTPQPCQLLKGNHRQVLPTLDWFLRDVVS